jgi:hypothetical protein
VRALHNKVLFIFKPCTCIPFIIAFMLKNFAATRTLASPKLTAAIVRDVLTLRIIDH